MGFMASTLRPLQFSGDWSVDSDVWPSEVLELATSQREAELDDTARNSSDVTTTTTTTTTTTAICLWS